MIVLGITIFCNVSRTLWPIYGDDGARCLACRPGQPYAIYCPPLLTCGYLFTFCTWRKITWENIVALGLLGYADYIGWWNAAVRCDNHASSEPYIEDRRSIVPLSFGIAILTTTFALFQSNRKRKQRNRKRKQQTLNLPRPTEEVVASLEPKGQVSAPLRQEGEPKEEARPKDESSLCSDRRDDVSAPPRPEKECSTLYPILPIGVPIAPKEKKPWSLIQQHYQEKEELANTFVGIKQEMDLFLQRNNAHDLNMVIHESKEAKDAIQYYLEAKNRAHYFRSKLASEDR